MLTTASLDKAATNYYKAVALKSIEVIVKSVQLPEEIEIKRTPLSGSKKERADITKKNVDFSASLVVAEYDRDIWKVLGIKDTSKDDGYIKLNSIEIGLEKREKPINPNLSLTVAYSLCSIIFDCNGAYTRDEYTGRLIEPTITQRLPQSKCISADQKIFTELYLAILNSKDSLKKINLLEFFKENFPSYVKGARESISQRLESYREANLEANLEKLRLQRSELDQQRSELDQQENTLLAAATLPVIPD